MNAPSQKHPRHKGNEEVKDFAEEVIQIDRVTRVVKGGRRLRFRATVVVGNRKGKVGVGVGKSNEVTGAIQKAVRQAKKKLTPVSIVNNTITHDIKFKYKSARILLMPATEGTGIIAGGSIRKVIELSGIKNILSKAFGSTNRINNARATCLALKSLMRPAKGLKEDGTSKESSQQNKNPKTSLVKSAPENEKKTDLTISPEKTS